MKNNIPEVGDIVVVNEESLDEMGVDKENWYNRGQYRGRLKVLKVDDSDSYIRIKGTNTKKQPWTLVIDDRGRPACSPQPVTKPLLLLTSSLRNVMDEQFSSKYCSCETPNLVTNSVLGKPFQFCRSCKKERQ